FASNEIDLFLAQGYLHAQERLWQMEMSRKFLAGRLAEIFGNFPVPWKESTIHFRGRETIEFDYFMRLIGIRDASVASLRLSSEEDRQGSTPIATESTAISKGAAKNYPGNFGSSAINPNHGDPKTVLRSEKALRFFCQRLCLPGST